MATRNAPTKRENVRVDPPETSLDPEYDVLQLVNPDGSSLENGKYNARFQYVWVDKTNSNQFGHYQGLSYRAVRYGADEVRPRRLEWTQYEAQQDNPDAEPEGFIERNEMCLMKRPVEFMHRDIAKTRELRRRRIGQMSTVSAQDQAQARSAHAEIEVDKKGMADSGYTFGS